MDTVDLDLRKRADISDDGFVFGALQVTFEAFAAVLACITLTFAFWKFRGRFYAHWHRHRVQQRCFELEAQLPEVCWLETHAISQTDIPTCRGSARFDRE